MIVPPVGPAAGGWAANASTVPVTATTTAGTANAAAATQVSGDNFATTLGKGLQGVQDAQAKADQLAVKAATGQLTDVHDYMIASTQATLATELTVAVRNKAVEAFNEIMRMPL